MKIIAPKCFFLLIQKVILFVNLPVSRFQQHGDEDHYADYTLNVLYDIAGINVTMDESGAEIINDDVFVTCFPLRTIYKY